MWNIRKNNKILFFLHANCSRGYLRSLASAQRWGMLRETVSDSRRSKFGNHSRGGYVSKFCMSKRMNLDPLGGVPRSANALLPSIASMGKARLVREHSSIVLSLLLTYLNKELGLNFLFVGLHFTFRNFNKNNNLSWVQNVQHVHSYFWIISITNILNKFKRQKILLNAEI